MVMLARPTQLSFLVSPIPSPVCQLVTWSFLISPSTTLVPLVSFIFMLISYDSKHCKSTLLYLTSLRPSSQPLPSVSERPPV